MLIKFLMCHFNGNCKLIATGNFPEVTSISWTLSSLTAGGNSVSQPIRYCPGGSFRLNLPESSVHPEKYSGSVAAILPVRANASVCRGLAVSGYSPGDLN